MTEIWSDSGGIDHERAHLHSLALLEPHELSLAHVRGLPPEAPIVEEPSEAQAHLEGLVIGRLGYLYDPERPKRHAEFFVPVGIDAGKEHLTLTARGSNLVAALHGLLPIWEPAAEQVESGIPGLRYRPSEKGTGVSFYRHGLLGRFTVEGISVDALERYRWAALLDAGRESVRPDDPLTPQEAASYIRPIESMRAASVLGRRLGLLVQAGVTAIDSWWNTANRLAVELMVSSGDPDPMPRILSQIQSPHLAPRLHLYRWGSDHHYLSIEGSTAEIDLRVLWVSAS